MLEEDPVDGSGGVGELAELLAVVVLPHEGGGGEEEGAARPPAAQPGVHQHVARAVPLPRVLFMIKFIRKRKISVADPDPQVH